MSDVGRYPTWVLLLGAVGSAVAVVVRYMLLDRGSNPRRLWLMLLAAWLVVIGLAASGALVTRNGERIAPNEGLLVLADLMVGMLVISAPVGRATRRFSDADLRRLRVRGALGTLLGRRRALAVMALLLGTMIALLAGEVALAARLPWPPALVACQDYATWSQAPANGTMPPAADEGILARASRVAPPGQLNVDLNALAADVRSAIFDTGTAQILDEARIVSDEQALDLDCKSVPTAS